MLDLSKNVSLVAIGSTRIKETHLAIRKCCSLATFSSVLYFTDKNNIGHDDCVKYIEIPKIKSKLEYQSFVVKDFPNYVLPHLNKSHILNISWDGFIVNPNAWKNYFLEFDYIGAPWVKEASPILAGHCGNGGFCLKSRKFLEAQDSIEDLRQYTPAIERYEDVTLSFHFRKKFESLGCSYAPVFVGNEFSTEHGNYDKHKSFGFHNLRINKKFVNKLL